MKPSFALNTMSDQYKLGYKKATSRKTLKKPVSPKVSNDAGAAETKISIFGQTFPKTDKWHKFDGLDLEVHESEIPSFQYEYKECMVTKKYFAASELYTTSCGNHVSADLIGKEWELCPVTGAAFLKSDGVKCSNIEKKEILVSPDGFTSGDFRKCEIDGGLYPGSHMRKLKRTSGESGWVFLGNLGTGSGFRQCVLCKYVYEDKLTEIAIHSINGVNNYSCTKCFESNKYKDAIGPHNYNIYPDPIYIPQYRMGSVKEGPGIYRATMEKSEVKPALWGVELETELDMRTCKKLEIDRFKLAYHIKKHLGSDFVICKEDGTLTTNGKYDGGELDPNGTGKYYAGFEIVSAPACIGTHAKRWGELRNFRFFNVLRAWDTETCGMHVHRDKRTLTTLQIGRMLVFINHPSCKKFIEMVAGRSETKFTRYVQKEVSDCIHPERVINPDEKKDRDRRRRVALNISNNLTVEWRIFRGTVNPRHIIRNLEFCDAMSDYCYPGNRSMADLCSPYPFINFVSQNRKRWRFLAEWMARWDLIKVPTIGEGVNVEKLTLKPTTVEEWEDKRDTSQAQEELSFTTKKNPKKINYVQIIGNANAAF